MKKTLFLSLIALISFGLLAQDVSDEISVERKPIQISVIPPLSIGKLTDPYIYHFSLSWIAGDNYGLQGLELGGVLNITKTNAGYAQFAGTANWVNRKFTGLQAAGAFNRSRTLKGVQLSGFLNSSELTSGVQAAGAINQTKQLNGVQISGLLNIAKSVNGIQIGIINIADTIEHGLSIGLINVVKMGLHHFELSSNDVAQAQLAFRSGGDNLYGIFYGGVRTQHDPLLTAGLGFGSRFWSAKNEDIFGTIEVMGGSITSTKGSFKKDLNLLNRLALNVGYQFNKRISVVGGPALNVYVTQAYDQQSEEFGFDIGRNNLMSSSSDKTNVRMWLGYQVGFWF
ncbi:hypothetical protein [Marinoscillum sp. MHG1-6]|uniref:hypothetical protein n=1 Tax=Marinoscillum sp. MHG1-6 TaxID=2959627 RepID=UPI00215744D0|nr:hypothetical protein [Marinoscillum sp. MHG1-6]